jgi:hypothetical protein
MPFLVKVMAQETTSAFLERMMKELGFSDEEYAKIKFMIGDIFANPQKGVWVRGSEAMGALIDGANISGEPYLFVLHPPERKQGSRLEQGVKIYN